LSHNLSPNHSLTPSVGQNDILAYSGFDTFKILSQSDLASWYKMGDTYFCNGRNNRRTDITETCLGSLCLQQGKGIQKNCQFEISTAKEQVFRLSHSKWVIATQNSSQPIKSVVRIENLLYRKKFMLKYKPPSPPLLQFTSPLFRWSHCRMYTIKLTAWV